MSLLSAPALAPASTLAACKPLQNSIMVVGVYSGHCRHIAEKVLRWLRWRNNLNILVEKPIDIRYALANARVEIKHEWRCYKLQVPGLNLTDPGLLDRRVSDFIDYRNSTGICLDQIGVWPFIGDGAGCEVGVGFYRGVDTLEMLKKLLLWRGHFISNGVAIDPASYTFNLWLLMHVIY